MHKLIYSKSEWRNKNYRFHLDPVSNTSIARGWFVDINDSDCIVRVIDQAGNIVEAIEYLKTRPKLVEIYPEINDVSRAGFEIDLKKLAKENDYSIAIFSGNEFIATMLFFVTNPPLLYVHIAKTAGSTVNKVLLEWFGESKSLVHVESQNTRRELVKQKKVDFLSGHIPYKAFMKVSEVQYYTKAITFREPYSHVISHISWIRALSLEENKARYEAHPEYIQRLSDKLASYDLSCPMQISEVIKSFNSLEHRLLDNTQTRYIRTNLAKESVTEVDFLNSIENLKDFDFVGTDNNISGFLEQIANDYGFDYKVEDRRENVLNNKFGLDINNRGIKEALLPLVKFDLNLYSTVKKYNY